MATLASKRLMKELAEINNKGTPPGIVLVDSESMQTWMFLISVLGDETVYEGETFALRMKFGSRYPIECPEVTFIADKEYQPPLHPHVVTEDVKSSASHADESFGPAAVLNAVAICITMQSMLASNKKKERPEGNDRYVRTAPSNPKLTRWHYDDDTV
ncbi:MAG: hypothetical protein TREMPRED_002270 [Tremellales sp. Tagirdzhanova-0007]|nr:MAG: hypothetical protein TREMPRED_002270 [Tremellales sp. Tagirdzhanova-0007]